LSRIPRILVVDDEDDVLLLVQTILSSARYTVLTARSGAEAIEIAARERPDAILLDVMMPEISGWEVCSRLKNSPETQSIPIVMLSVKSEIRDLITSMQADDDDHVTQPFSRQKLVSTIQRLLDRGSAILEPLLRRKDRIVLEVTDRTAIRDIPRFRSCIDELRATGFRIAIDDAGSGFASLQAIAELRPGYLKVANILVTGLSSDPIKRDIVEMLLHVARRIDATCVAEGIETEQDLQECRRIGIPLGQGYFLGMPREPAA